MGIKSIFKKSLISICLLFTLILLGCVNNRSYNDQLNFVYNWNNEFSSIQNPKLYESKIQEEINYFSPTEKTQQEVELKAKELMLSYARLYVIESQRGNKSKANIYFIKTKYWYLMTIEHLNFYSPEDINKKLAALTENDVRKSVLELNPDFVKNMKNTKEQK